MWTINWKLLDIHKSHDVKEELPYGAQTSHKDLKILGQNVVIKCATVII